MGLLILPAALTAQGAMANGQNYVTTIGAAGEVDTYTFSATAGDAIMLAIGEVGADSPFVPWIRLYRPDMTQIGNQSGTLAAQIDVAAPSTGIYTVQVASADAGLNDTGTYTLTLAKSPGAFTISPGDDGGTLTNGSNHSGVIHVGDLDMWSFDATAGDAIMLGIGETGGNTAFNPWIRLRSPTGQNLGSVSGPLANQIDVAATVTGTYTVIVASADAGLDGAGDYTLTLVKSPGAITISDGDEGGPAENGRNHTGHIHIGDLDAWTFTANAGDAIMIGIGEAGADTAFNPWIRLRSPTGQNLGSESGPLAQQIDVAAPVSGTYTIIVASADAGLDAAGDYTLTLAKSPGAFTIDGGDEGGTLTNGSNHTGAIHVGDLDMWRFDANAGDAIMIGIGEVGNSAFNPWMRLRSPTGQNLGSVSGVLAQQLDVAAPVTGTYTIIVASGDAGLDATGSYTLTLAKSPGAFAISGGDEGGAMTNGQNHTGDLHVGDLDMWSFQAVAGEALTVSIGEVGADTAFNPWLRLRSPTGQNLGSVSSTRAQTINTNATVTGTYTVVVASGDAGLDATGSYTLTIANTPRTFVVPGTDQGGPIVVGDPNPGIIHIGDVDMWTFIAHANDPLTVSITDINSPGTSFTPWIRLRSPTGVLVSQQTGATTATIITTAPATGTYTVLVSSADPGFAGFGDYELTVSGTTNTMIRNGDFSNGETFWNFFATPTLAYIVHQVNNGVLEYYRVPPPAGTTNQAVAYQETGIPLPAGAPVVAQFDLANTSSVRKRISVLVLDFDFSDLSVCTFWLEANAPMRTYRMRTHTTQPWVNTALYFYAATAGDAGGRYQIDNVSMQYVEEQADDRTDCVDPTAPTAVPGALPGPELLVNGNFSAGSLDPWFTFGTITSQLTNGVFEFIKPSSVQPSGVVAQYTGQPMPAGQILTATFRLGNTSSVRKRVTVLVHDRDFTDLSACTFWLAPGQPLSTYEYRTFATRPWTNAMLSVYPATIGLAQWIQLDDVTLRQTPGTAIAGTECIEPPSSEAPLTGGTPETGMAAASNARATSAMGHAPAGAVPGAVVADEAARGVGQASDFETIDLRDAVTASLLFESRRHDAGFSRALVQVSRDAITWTTLDAVPASEDWTAVHVDLSAFAGEVVRVRFVLDVPDLWRIRGLGVVIR